MTENNILIADIGGTNARFALACDGPEKFKDAKTLKCSDFQTLEAAMDAYLEQESISRVIAIYFAAAGAIKDQTMRLTNNDWVIDMGKLQSQYGANSARLLNDFEAISYALPELNEKQLQPIGSNWELPQGDDLSLGVLGPGSGLGVGGLIKQGNKKYYPLITECGHTGFAPENAFQLELLRILLDKYQRVSNERLLSGPGLENIYQAICLIDGVAAKNLSAREIGKMASESSDDQCQSALMLFFELLGQVAGDVALAQAAFSGIYIGGGIAQRYPEILAASKFRAGFEHKGRQSHLLKSTPTFLITEQNPGLIGASSYALKYLSLTQN